MEQTVESIDHFKKIFEEDSEWNGDNAFQGLQIIAKYIDQSRHNLIVGASHDIIYSVGLNQLIENRITVDDALMLRKLNWSIQYDSLYCFV